MDFWPGVRTEVEKIFEGICYHILDDIDNLDDLDNLDNLDYIVYLLVKP